VNIACALTNSPAGAQSLPICSVNPANEILLPGGVKTLALSVSTTAASTASLSRPTQMRIWGLGCGGSVLAAVLMMGIPSRRRRSWASMLVLLWIVMLASSIGCGGAKSTLPPAHSGTIATTSGTYKFIVTATDAVNSTISTSATVSLTVQ
jgi:hypothetical protein